MVIVLLIVCFILVCWVVRLDSELKEQKRFIEYNAQRYEKVFEDIEASFKSDREDREHLLDRIHDLEK